MSGLEPTRTYSNHTATDVLRRLLDERGVEYVVDEEYGEKYPPEQRVTWSCDLAGEDMIVTARDYCININDDGSADYCLDLEFHEVFTPEQAIAATLGSCNCPNNCTNGERTETCHITDNGPWGYPYVCSACGASFDPDVNNGEVNFCPNCGRRIVDPTTNYVDMEVEQ